MRHKKHHHTLGVTTKHRSAMLSNLAASLVEHGRIQTTLAKARALRPFIEKLITKAKKAAAAAEKKDKLHLHRLAARDLRAPEAVTKLFGELVNEFTNRPGGYTRIYKLGARGGDAAEMALIEFVKADDQGYKKSRGKKASKSKGAAKAKATADAAPVPATESAPAAEEKKD